MLSGAGVLEKKSRYFDIAILSDFDHEFSGHQSEPEVFENRRPPYVRFEAKNLGPIFRHVLILARTSILNRELPKHQMMLRRI